MEIQNRHEEWGERSGQGWKLDSSSRCMLLSRPFMRPSYPDLSLFFPSFFFPFFFSFFFFRLAPESWRARWVAAWEGVDQQQACVLYGMESVAALHDQL